MSNRCVQYRVPKEELYFLYRFIILPWEMDWKQGKFITSIGNLKEYEKSRNILLKCFESISDLEVEADNYPKKFYDYAGVMLFNRTGNKPKAILRHLGHLCAHGHFRSKTVGKRQCLGFKHHSDKDNRLRAIGHLPFDELKPLIRAVITTKVD